jgi:cellulose synthase/poly-beta-1,6-N-acetylglucosamine synthase-like glycosyltransferase
VALTVAVISGAALLAVWLGYPIALWVAPGRPRSGPPRASTQPFVSVVLATRAEPAEVAARVANLWDTDHPPERLEIIVAVDATAPTPSSAYSAALAEAALVTRGDPPGGKACALNSGVRLARGDVLVFTDSAQRFTPRTIPELIGAVNADVGAVTGRYEMAGTSAVVKCYWRYELFVRRQEARVHSVVGATGAVYALQRPLWRPLPARLILDDVLVPLQAVRAGARVAMCDAATAQETRDFHARDELRRRVRTLTGVLQLCLWEPWIMAPWVNPIAVQFWVHKLGRLATPYFAAIAAVALLYAAGPRTALVTALVAACGMAVAWLSSRSRASGPLLAVKLLLLAPLRALANAACRRWDVW